jgi:hypothetical protein
MPELIEQLASECGIPVRKQGALRLIRREDCEKVLAACKSGKVLILGIEAFTLAESKVVPDTDLIADFSELASKQWDIACVEAASSAEGYFKLASERKDLWFDFSLQQR